MAEAAPIGIFLTTPTGECVYTNPIWSTISGLTAEESLGYGWMRAIHPDELERVKQSWHDAAAQRKDYATDYRLITPAEDLRWVHALATPQVDASGKVVSYVGVVEDITERKRAEEALRERENQLSLIYDNIPDLVSRVDRDLRYLFVNASYERRFGAPAAAIVGRTVPEVIGEEAFRRAEPYIKRALDGERVTFENPLKTASGEPLLGLTTLVPDLDMKGEVQGFFVVVHDITERKRAEEAFRESEARKAAIFESALDCIITINHEGKIVEFNAAAEKTFGYTRAETLGKAMSELIIPPSLRDGHRRGLAHYLSTGEGPVLGKEIEITAMRADGTEFPVELAITRIPLNGPPVFTGYVRDITERKRAEQQARDNLQRVEALRAIEQAIASSLDLQSVLQILLEKIELFLPIATARTVRLLNRETGKFEFVACRGVDAKEWNASRTGARSWKVIATQSPVAVLNIDADPLTHNREIFRKYGLVSYLGIPLIAKGEVLGVLGIYTGREHEFNQEEIDLLTTLANHAAIALHNAQLHEQTKKHAADLEKTNKVKDEFLGVISHELRTPLGVVTGYAGMIKDRLLGEINLQQEQALEKVLTRAADQLAMINDILQTAQIEARVVALEPQPVDLNEFLDQLKSDYAVRAEKKDVRLLWDYPTDADSINTDRAKLQQILQNLINNALKFTAEGSVTVSARVLSETGNRGNGESGNRGGEVTDSPVHPFSGTARRWVELRVADTGIGIPAEQMRSIFDKFFQVDSSATRHYGGVGLGLYIVKQFTDLLGGKVEVESELGKGSTFTVTIPSAP